MFYECYSLSQPADENITHLSREVNVSHKLWQIETNFSIAGSHMIYRADGPFIMDIVCKTCLFTSHYNIHKVVLPLFNPSPTG